MSASRRLPSIAVKKRTGEIEPFDSKKITAAVQKCFVTVGNENAVQDADAVSVAVNHIVKHCNEETVSVEKIQEWVIQQLWAQNFAEAATHYTLYREQRRQDRTRRPIPADYIAQVNEDAKHFPTDLQYYQFLSKFSRWNEDAGRRESWRECCDRVMGWFHTIPEGKKLTTEEWGWLDKMMYELKASPAMRVTQMAGPALERCHVGAYNCAYHPITDIFAFSELLYILMQGSGAGFSVEYDYISELPKVKKQKTGNRAVVHKLKVEDSTEGWCDTVFAAFKAWWDGDDVDVDVSGVREAGALLKTKGGRASGPGPLLDLLAFAKKIILSAQGRRLTDLQVHDICCMIGKIVQVGGVRRASCISLSDLDSMMMRGAKSGNWYDTNIQRTMANNSAVYDEKPSIYVFMEEWLALANSKSGERGIFNREGAIKKRPQRRKYARFGCNPCAEILLRMFQFCNLSIAVARFDDTFETLVEKVRAATFFGKLQSCCTNFKYIRPEWKKNCEEERLLGVDITGHADCPLLRYGAPGRAELLRKLKKVVEETDIDLSARFGINRSAANTTVKPAGDSAVFFNCGSGISPWFAKYGIRRTRESIHSPMTAMLKDACVPWEIAPEDESLVAFSWPKQAPPGATTRNDLTAIQQLENWLEWKKDWAEHSVSVTIYIDDHEWLEAGAWVYKNWDDVSGISFLPKDNGNYRVAPNEELTEEQYNKMLETFPKLEWHKLMRYEYEDHTTSTQTLACKGDLCEIAPSERVAKLLCEECQSSELVYEVLHGSQLTCLSCGWSKRSL